MAGGGAGTERDDAGDEEVIRYLREEYSKQGEQQESSS